MNNPKPLHLRLFFVFLSLLSYSDSWAQRDEKWLSHNWKFILGEQAEAESLTFNDSSWSTVVIPHDYAIQGPFDRQNDLQDVRNIQNGEMRVNRKTGRTGGLPYEGVSWYRIWFQTSKNKTVLLAFDGVMSEATIFINGRKKAFQPNGYAAFTVDITDETGQGGRQLLAVRVENHPQSSRWYPGAGIFRPVRLIQVPASYFPIWGTTITTPLITSDKAVVQASNEISASTTDNLLVKTTIYDNKGLFVAEYTKPVGSSQGKVVQQFKIPHPELWSPEHPALYTLKQRLYQSGRLQDSICHRIGLRTVEFKADKGFFLNGERRQIQGVCVHHDLGALGSAVNESVIRYRLSLLKDMGCDAIRTSHNLPSSILPRLCDEMGFMLLIEPFDEWDSAKCHNGFHRYFNLFGEQMVRDMVRHFRNHPSVILWGIGNEVPNQRDNLGYQLVERLQRICHEEDPTRSVTVCMDQIPYVLKNGFAHHVDIPGINYNVQNYSKAFSTWPQHLILGSETASTVSSRSVYKFPLSLKKMAIYDDHQSSGYDVECCSWSNTPDKDFALADDNPWYLGQFVWTGFDYLGEPTPYNNDNWPSHSSLFGIIDLANLPKDRYYLYRSQWNKQEHTLHIVPHWTWPGREKQITPVMVYTDYPSAELFLNGRSLGRQKKYTLEQVLQATNDSLAELRRYRLIWENVAYELGELKVIAYDSQGRRAAEASCRTAGTPVRLKSTVSNPTLHIGGNEAAVITVSAVDKDGNLCPWSTDTVSFSMDGGAVYLGAANGDPTCLAPLKGNSMPLFGGQLTAVIGAGSKSGKAVFTATAHGLDPSQLSFTIKP